MTDAWRAFDVAVAGWRLGGLPAERLPAAAMRALEAGCEGASLAQLAAIDGASWSEVEPVVASVLDARGCDLPDEDQARKAVADDLLRRMVAGELPPEVACDRLRDLSTTGPGPLASDDLGAFDRLAMDWRCAEDLGWDLDPLRGEMLCAARELLDRGGVRIG